LANSEKQILLAFTQASFFGKKLARNKCPSVILSISDEYLGIFQGYAPKGLKNQVLILSQ
jgi:hypothetical protein